MSAEQKIQEAGWDVNRAVCELEAVRRHYGQKDSQVPRALSIAITELETAGLWIHAARALAMEDISE